MTTTVVDAVIELLRQREAKGLAKYGTALQPFNGRSAEQDALEETLDLVQYLMQAKLERAELERELAAAKARLEAAEQTMIAADNLAMAVEFELATLAGQEWSELRDYLGCYTRLRPEYNQ